MRPGTAHTTAYTQVRRQVSVYLDTYVVAMPVNRAIDKLLNLYMYENNKDIDRDSFRQD